MTELPAIRVRQWLDEWDQVPTDASKFQSQPPREFFIASIKASHLKALSGVFARDATTGTRRADDPYVQRTLERDRTTEIRDYIKVGFPLSSLGSRKMADDERRSLRKPGWLPTAIIANLIPSGATRDGKSLDNEDAMSISDMGGSQNLVNISLPASWSGEGWRPKGGVPPLEIIDGQHRLSAFDEDGDDDFDLPVVVFDGLDFSWQAYIFWTVNIKPKRINASLAYDLYPLLREQDWLEAGESLVVYRETRAQELVESLWAAPESVWHDRINMLGQPGMRNLRPVTQSAFVRSLASSFVRPFRGYRGLGGLFGGSADSSGLDWPRGQQAAFIVYAWNALANAIAATDHEWARPLREDQGVSPLWSSLDARLDPAVVGPNSLLASDQGVRAFHMVVNDISYLGAERLSLREWRVGDSVDESPDSHFSESFADLGVNGIGAFLVKLGESLSQYDWRNAKAPDLSRDERTAKQALRGAGGYNVLRDRLLEFLAESDFGLPTELATEVLVARGG